MSKHIVLITDNLIIKKRFNEIISVSDCNDFELTLLSEKSKESITIVLELKPDLLIIDSEISYFDVVGTIDYIMKTSAMPILVISNDADAGIAFSAISSGALDILSKREILSELPVNINSKLKLLSEIAVIQHPGAHNLIFPIHNSQEKKEDSGYSRKILVIGSSTGGPKALSVLFSMLPENTPYPIVTAQHISAGFIDSLVKWLSRDSKLKVKVPEEGETPGKGSIYLVPPEKHMTFRANGTMEFHDPGPKDIYHPSCDKLFSSAADVYGHNTIGLILTGMGDDGAKGIKKIKEAGGYTIAQDEESSFIFGMPKSAIDTGCIDKILSLSRIADELIRMFQ